MTQKLSTALEKSLLHMDKYGLKPPINELQELIKQDLIESIQVDGWGITQKGRMYLINSSLNRNTDAT